MRLVDGRLRLTTALSETPRINAPLYMAIASKARNGVAPLMTMATIVPVTTKAPAIHQKIEPMTPRSTPKKELPTKRIQLTTVKLNAAGAEPR